MGFFSSLLSTLPAWVWCERSRKSFSTNSCKLLEALFEWFQYCPVCLWLYPHVVLYKLCCHVQLSLSYRLPRVTPLLKCLLLPFYTCDFMWKQEAQPCIHQHNYTVQPRLPVWPRWEALSLKWPCWLDLQENWWRSLPVWTHSLKLQDIPNIPWPMGIVSHGLRQLLGVADW